MPRQPRSSTQNKRPRPEIETSEAEGPSGTVAPPTVQVMVQALATVRANLTALRALNMESRTTMFAKFPKVARRAVFAKFPEFDSTATSRALSEATENFYQADSDVGRVGAGGGLPGGGGGGSSSGGASGPSSEAARLALAEGPTTRPVESSTGGLEHATHPHQTRFTQLEIEQQQKVTALKEQWFSHNSEKLLSVAATKTLGELQRVLISMEMNETSLQDSIALLRTKRGTQGAVERLQVVLKSTQLDVAYLSSKVLTLEGFIHVYNMADDTDDPEACKQHFSKKWALVNKDPKQILEVVKSFTDGAVFGKMVEDALRNGRSSSGDNKRTPRAAGLDAPGGVGEITSGAGNSTSPAPGGSKKNVRFKGGKGGKGRKSGN